LSSNPIASLINLDSLRKSALETGFAITELLKQNLPPLLYAVL